MATASTGWGVTCIASVTRETETTATIKVDVYWQNNGWDYNINRVSAWAYCGSASAQVLNSGSVNSTTVGMRDKVLLGSYSFTVNKTTTTQKISCYGTITSNSSYVSGTKTSTIVTVSVKAKTSYTISYNLNGGSGSFSAQTKWYGANLTLHGSSPTRTGYTFKGWSTTSGGSVVYGVGATYSANASTTLYAVWQIVSYTISYNANGGSGAPGNQTKNYGTALTLSSTIPTRANYTFLGWSTYQNATSPQYLAGGSYTANASATLYAVWSLSYIAPRVTDFVVTRCDSDGTLNEEGTYVKVSFDWATDKSATAYAIYYKQTTNTEYTGMPQVALSGTSGSVSTIINGVTFSTAYSYNIKVNVADSNGFTSKFGLVNAMYIPIDFSKNRLGMCLGETATEEDGLLRLAFKNIDLAPKNRLRYQGEAFFGQSLLWSGSAIMDETHYIDLPKKVSECKNGLLLVFSRAGDYNIISYFVPKDSVVSFGRTGWCFPLCTAIFDYIGSKTLYISDDKIEGHANNDDTGKNETSGITYHNEAFRLRFVYEV